MGTKVVVVGIGAIGGQVAAHMARTGEDVTGVDIWPEHIETIRKRGMEIVGMKREEDLLVPLNALHISDVQSLSKGKPVDVAIISVKSYDTEWATRMIAPYLASDGFVVSLQNSINEEQIAKVVGWDKTMGVAICQHGAELVAPGKIQRNMEYGGDRHCVFRVGEVHGRITPRAEEVARLMRPSDSSKVTTNLWGERWSKLVINSMRNGLSSVIGMGGNARDLNEITRTVSIRLGSETTRVGQALGYQLEDMVHMQPDTLGRAGEGDKAALDEIANILIEGTKRRAEEQRPSMAQDIAKGRRTETDYINGLVAAKGAELGIKTPVNARINELVKQLERGEIKAGIENVVGI